MKRLIYLALLIAIPCFGQAVRYNGNAYSVNASSPQPGALYPVLASASATIQICTYSTTETCPSLATTYTDATGATPCDVTAQLTPSNSGACTAVVEASGTWGAWLHAGNYQYTITTPAGTFGPYNFTAGGSGGSSAVTSASNSDGTLTVTPTTGAVVASLALGHANTWTGQQTFVVPILGTPASGILTNATGLPLTTGVTGLLPIANGGTATSSPALVAGTNVTITGSWPNQTINSSASGSGTVSGQASGVVGLGTGATTTGAQSHINENTSGVTNVTQTLAAPTLIGGAPSSGALAALPSGAHGIANDESSTAGVPAAGVDYLRADAAAHCYKESVNGGAETCIGAGGSGTVTTVSVATANGFQGTVANPTTTPAISVNVDGSHLLPVNTGSSSLFLNQAGGYTTPAGGATPSTVGISYWNGSSWGTSYTPVALPNYANASNTNNTVTLPNVFTNYLLNSSVMTNGQSWNATCTGIGNSVLWDAYDGVPQYVAYAGGASSSQCVNANDATGREQIGSYTSPDGVTWTASTLNPTLPYNPTGSQPDSGGQSYPQIYRNTTNNLWYAFYTCSASAGFEVGQIKICMSTTTNLLYDPSNHSNPPVWTRHGAQVTDATVPWVGSGLSVYRPHIVQVGPTYYMWINGMISTGNEAIGYLTATSLDGPWTGHSTYSVCSTATTGCSASGAGTISSSNGALADPYVTQYGHQFIMSGWNGPNQWYAVTTDDQYPGGWEGLALNTTSPIIRASSILMGSANVIYATATPGATTINRYGTTAAASGSPGGASGTVQYNNSGAFGGAGSLTSGGVLGMTDITASDPTSSGVLFPLNAFCPNLPLTGTNLCAITVGNAVAAHEVGFMIWQSGVSGDPSHLSFQTFAAGDPVQFGGLYEDVTGPMIVNSGANAGGQRISAGCAGGIALCVNSTSSFTVSTTGTVAAPNIGVSNAVTSATGGSGTGTITCATASCTNLRGSYTVAGGTFATGTLLTLVWPTTTTAYVCSGAVLNNATGASIGYHSVATATGMTFSSLTAATGLNIDIDYSCQP